MKLMKKFSVVLLAILVTLSNCITVNAKSAVPEMKNVAIHSSVAETWSAVVNAETKLPEENGVVENSPATLPSGIATEDIGKQIEAYVAEHKDTTAGMAFGLFDEKNTIYENYFGNADKEHNIAVNQDTVFEWGSCSKLLVWVSVMQLWEQGKIDLNADIRDYLPEGFLTNLKYDTPVTMTNLMNHNAGFQEVLSDLFIKEGSNVPNLGDALKLHEPDQIFEPGTVTAYSNWSVALAGYIVECVSGESYDQYVKEHIFEVLHMDHTAIRPDLSDNDWVKEKRKELECYSNQAKRLSPSFYHISLYPAGMCTSTLADYKAFAQGLLQKDSPLFQSPVTREELFSPTSYFGDTGIARNCHGFWNIIFDATTVGHGGNTAGCSSYLLLDLKDHIGSVVMTNQAYETTYNSDMMKLIYGSFENSNNPKPSSVPKGLYRIARMVYNGPLSFVGAVNISAFTEDDLNEFFSYQTLDGLGVVSQPYMDILQLSNRQLVTEIFLLGSYAIGLLVSLGYLISWPIGYLIRKRKKKTNVITSARKLRRISAGLVILLALLLLSIGLLIVGCNNSSTYTWIFAVIGILGIMMVIVLGLFIRALIKDHTRKEIISSGFMMFFLIMSVVNIVYWDMFMFWKM